MVTDVDAALPPDGTVTLIGDRALPSAALIDACRAVGWDVLFRLSTDARQGSTVRLSDGTPRPLWDLVTGPGQRVTGEVALVRKARWRWLHLTIRWATGHDAPWLLISTRPGGADRLDRLVLVVQVALWWGMHLGLRAIRRGERHRDDRRGPRALSVLRIGRAARQDALDRLQQPPPLPFHPTAIGLVFTWLA